MNRSTLLIAAMLASGCAPKVYVRGMSAASVDIPTDVQRVAVVDRSRPKNAGQTVLGAIEGAVTGEVPLEDNQGRDQAIAELVRTLESAPRYEVVRPVVTPKQVDSDLRDTKWSHKAVGNLCAEHGCDAVIALETFDTDAQITMGRLDVPETVAPAPSPEPEPAGKGSSTEAETGETKGGTMSRDGATAPKPAPEPAPAPAPTPAEDTEDDEPPPFTHWAERRTRLNATWRIYDADEDVILDEDRDRAIGSRNRAEGYSTEEAAAKLASASAMITADGRKLGSMYAKRISPTWVGFQRKYYGGGMAFGRPPMKQAKIHVKAGDWDGAADIWKGVVDDPKTGMKKRGKARYNLALAAEVKGRLKMAQKLAQKAAVEANTKTAQSYARSLERRIEEQKRVEEQLAAPEEMNE